MAEYWLYDPMEDEHIAGPVEADSDTEAAGKLLDIVGYQILRKGEKEND